MTKHFMKDLDEISSKSDIWTSLRLVSLFPETQLKKIMKKRESLKDQLSEQILMATNRSYSPMKYRWLTETDGHVRRIAVPIKLKKWWREIPTGKLQLCIYVRGKALELEVGKNAIEIDTYSELIPTLQLIQQAVDLGDFDELL